MHSSLRSGLLVVAGLISLTAVAAEQPDSIALDIKPSDTTSLRQWDAWVSAHERAGELRVRERVADPILAGRDHERLEQFHRGVRVFGGGVTRQWSGGRVETLFGRVHDGLSLSVEPSLTAADAVLRAGCDRVIGSPELNILVEGGTPLLTWKVTCYFPGDVAALFVNAGSGRLEDRITSIHRQSAIGDGRGVYLDRKKVSARRVGSSFNTDDPLRPPVLVTFDLRGDLNRAIRLLNNQEAPRPSDIATDADNIWEDGAVVDGHVYVGLTYDYFFKRFRRRGLDDRDTPIRTIIHPVTQEGSLTLGGDEFGLFAVNAFWCGVCGPDQKGMMVFGDGIPPDLVLQSGQTVNFLAASLDIAAHELTHGVTDFTSRLIYRDESGALNEAFSDIMGASVEFFYQPVGSAIGQADYKIGEDSFQAAVFESIDGIRSLSAPTVHGDPDHYSLRFLGKEDEGGVHTNSLIASHAFYLAIEGGPHRLGSDVQGVGAANRDQIEKVFYRAFTLFLPPTATFSMARAATIQAARDLYGGGSAAERAVTQAWDAVGVR